MDNASVTVNGSNTGTPLTDLLNADSIEPGSDASYQLCKLIYTYHPLGKKMADFPVDMAMSQPRKVVAPGALEERIRQRHDDVWRALKVDDYIKATMSQARVYGVTTAIWNLRGNDPAEAIDLWTVADGDLYFSVFDPLITAGSMVTNQDPNSPDYLKTTVITAGGKPYSKGRTFVQMNERPMFISYTDSSFGYVGRSVYQRALFPLKTFIQSMLTDDMVTVKAGVIVLKVEQPGSIADNILGAVTGKKRTIVKQAVTGNVINIGQDDDAKTLDMQNTADAMTTARKNVIENIASAADMPAQILNAETFAEGFGEGTEDAKKVAAYIGGVRKDMEPIYGFFDSVVPYVAFSREFFDTLLVDFPELKSTPYQTWFTQLKNSLRYEWPSLLQEPESELAKMDDTRARAVVSFVEVAAPMMDPENKAELFRWAQANFNEFKRLFPEALHLDIDALVAYVPPDPPTEPAEPKPFGGGM